MPSTNHDVRNTKLLINVSNWLFNKQIEELQEYCRAMERLIARELAEIDAELQEGAAALDPDARAEYFDYNSDYYQLVDDTFKNRLRLSSITLIHSIVERRVIRIAKMFGKDKELKLADLSASSPIEKSQKYIKSVLGVTIEPNDWARLKTWTKIRNMIAHADGAVKADDLKQLEPFLRSHPDALRVIADQLVASDKLVPLMIADVTKFNQNLHAQLVAWEMASTP